ncbi:regulatory protein RecX [Sulfurihydrogenibium subterraneum]|uniref:regulatory protein RecX n=1 Tax=Sulfurihydrogenibium subterraneum TaxID=171121 RepID=UPI001FE119C8|nr:regulatory protein RecX [Sulfurihydrogenibium subterraneum]
MKQISEPMDSNVKSYAYKLLSKKDYFKEELKNKLLRKGFEERQVEEVIKHLESQGLLNDEKLKERYKEVYINKGKSYLKLRNSLYRKGITEIDLSEDEELKSALNLLKKSFKKEKTFENMVKFLKNRGFRYSVIKKAIEIMLKEEE